MKHFAEVNVTTLIPSPSNPPGRTDGQEFQELVESIVRHGVLQPLVVRPVEGESGRFEIIAGHRRAAAAKLAGLAIVPTVVHDGDVNVREIQLEENLRRKDLHALEEAQGYLDLMGETQETVAGIAARLGRSVRYVYDRLNLLKLRPELQKVFRAGEITPGHAIILARLSPAEQSRVLDTDLFIPERSLFDEGNDDLTKQEPRKAISVRELQCWVDEHVRIEPATTDSILFPETVAALADADKVIPITYSYHLRDSARSKERTFGPQSWKRADGEQKSKLCELAVTGLVVAGPHRGEAFAVCTKKDKCKVHWGAEMRAKAKRAADGGTRRPRNEEKIDTQQRDPELQKRLDAAQDAANKVIAGKVVAAAQKMSTPDLLRFVLGAQSWAMQNALIDLGVVDERANGTVVKNVATKWLKAATIKDLSGALALVAVAEADHDYTKVIGIDARKIVDGTVEHARANYVAEKKAATKAEKPKSVKAAPKSNPEPRRRD